MTESDPKISMGDGLLLRRWSARDEASLLQYANNRKVSIYLRDRFPFPYTVQDARWWLDWAGNENPLLNFAIVLNGEPVGGAGLTMGEDIFRCSAEIGYWIGEPHWGKGIATRAVCAVTDYGFKNFPLKRIWAGVFADNAPSGKVLEKAGFTFESRKRNAVIKLGKVQDELIYATVRD